MQTHIDLITIVSHNVPAMVAFYRDVLGFTVKLDLGNYVEFEPAGIRFALCAAEVMHEATGEDAYTHQPTGFPFELAFAYDTQAAVDAAYAAITAGGGRGVQPPAVMPWNQYAGFFTDPDGNLHEIFCELPATN